MKSLSSLLARIAGLVRPRVDRPVRALAVSPSIKPAVDRTLAPMGKPNAQVSNYARTMGGALLCLTLIRAGAGVDSMPALQHIPGSTNYAHFNLDYLRQAALSIGSDTKGRIYVLSRHVATETDGNPRDVAAILRVYPRNLAGVPILEVTNANFYPTFMEVKGSSIFLVGKPGPSFGGFNWEIRRFAIQELADNTVSISPKPAATRALPNVELKALAVAEDTSTVYLAGVNVGGKGGNFWKPFNGETLVPGAGREWYWDPSILNVPFLNGHPTALTVDRSGNVYVAGFWEDPQGDKKGNYLDIDAVLGLNQPKGRNLVKVDLATTSRKMTPYIVKFRPNGEPAAYRQDDPNGDDVSGVITGLRFVQTPSGGRIIAVESFEGRSTISSLEGLESRNWSGKDFVGDADIVVSRFDTSLEPVPPAAARVASASYDGGYLAIDPSGNVFLSGPVEADRRITFYNGGSISMSILSSLNTYYVARLSGDFLTWSWVRAFDETKHDALDGTADPAGRYGVFSTAWYPVAKSILFAGQFSTGTFTLVESGAPDEELGRRSIPSQGPHQYTGFVGHLVGDSGAPVILDRLYVASAVAVDRVTMTPPIDGSLQAVPGRTNEVYGLPAKGTSYTVSVPPVVYLDRTSKVIVDPTPAQIETNAWTRHVCTGFSLEGSDTSGSANSVSLVFQQPTRIRFHWRTEHALVIDSRLSDTHATTNQAGQWQKDSQGFGLTSKGSGNPEPAVNKHWVEENAIVSPAIDGIVYETGKLGVRYAVAGYIASGAAAGNSAKDVTNRLSATLSRQMVIPDPSFPVGFLMKRPASVTWLWKPQFQIQQTTTSSRSEDLPGLGEVRDGRTNFVTGAGQFWFDEGTRLLAGSRSDLSGPGRNLLGVQLATDALSTLSGMSVDRLPAKFTNLVNKAAYRGVRIDNLTNSATVVWNFGDPIYRQYVTLGDFVSFDRARFDPLQQPSSDVLGFIDTNAAPRPRIISAPPGSTDDGMAIYDGLRRVAYPVRPGVFFVEWKKRPPIPDGDSGMVIMQIHAGFAGDRRHPETATDATVFPTTAQGRRHYRHLAHPDMPAVDLDPDPGDTYFFAGLRYSESDGTAQDGGFNARAAGRHVLQFMHRPDPTSPGGPPAVATGDPSLEEVLIRVVETRPWNATNGWATGPMLKTNAAPVTIGARVTSPEYDRAKIQSGFIVYPNARYNGNIYDRTRPNGGPIIPVNRQFTGREEDRITLVWYEAAETDATPGNLLWPYQSVVYPDAVWPTRSSLTTLPTNQPLDRIVIASRLGSEGRNSAHQVQTSFDPLLFDQVKIYHQPDINAPGYNPNEEHALIAPSFKQLDLPSPPPTAYALRNDLNRTQPDTTYSSDPYVLVEYLDRRVTPAEFKMAVYSVEKEDHWPDLNPYRYPEMEADLRDLEPIRLELATDVLAGRQTRTNWVIADYTGRADMAAAKAAADADLLVRSNDPPALVALGFATYALKSSDPELRRRLAVPSTLPAVKVADEKQLADALTFAAARLAAAEAANASANGYDHRFNQTMLAARRVMARFRATQREFPYTFRYGMKAGEPVQAPYPLPLVIGLSPCSATTGYNTETNRVYWEDYKGGAWAVSQGFFTSDIYYPLQPSFWYGDGADAVAPGTCLLFPTAGESTLTGRPGNQGVSGGTSFSINGVTLVVPGAAASTQTRSVMNNVIAGKGIPNLESSLNEAGQLQLRLKTNGILTIREITGTPLANLGLLQVGQTIAMEGASTNVAYDTTWPETLPILKAGETLTFAGGEYKADHPGPEQPGLPGVIGWAAGRILYDSMNPVMDNVAAFTKYTAQLISPLEEREVRLDTLVDKSDLAAFRDLIQPAKSLTRTAGIRWKFNGLSSSVDRRIYFDPMRNVLGIKGYVNDKTLGDTTLTAAPPPIYVLEPNLLTRRERDELLALDKLRDNPVWKRSVNELYRVGRNPRRITSGAETEPSDPYYPGLEMDVEQFEGNDQIDDDRMPVTIANTARPQKGLGPGLALVPSPQFMSGTAPDVSYVTLVENNDESLGGPISVFIVKVMKQHRYRGAIKTMLSDNVFDEKITLRHTGDFGGNADSIVYQWFYREENGQPAPLPPSDSWQLFSDTSDQATKGLGMYHIRLDGSGGLLLGDNVFFVRYRHVDDRPFGDPLKINSVEWGKSRLADESGQSVPAFRNDPADHGTAWNRDGAPFRDPEQRGVDGLRDLTNPLRFGGEWAGAANSPTVDLDYRPQLVMGWIKRVLDRVNPYEARFSDFRNHESPATYASMIQQAGQPYVGPVALNPDKNVIENVGLIELYQTILDRGINLSIGLSSPLSTPGINNALLLAATRISDLYMVLANEAYTDALDPTIGFGSFSVEYGSLAPSVFAFQNQLPSLLDEELALLRGIDDDRRRPMHNRLFWNFTKGEGEVAYAMNYNIHDVNHDGFIDENDALIQYPQGHGDAWGHYLTALKSRYRLLRHPFFSWQPRSEFYNLLDVVIPVDFLDERKFAQVAAAKAQAGTEIVNLTYRSRYVEDPDGQWQGYSDTPAAADGINRDDWGVAGWARRAGQGALFDWMTANALIPWNETNKTGIAKVDRSTVPEIATIAANLGAVQNTYDNANGGLNPLGLDSDVVPFDIDPTFLDVGSTAQIGRRAVQGLTHFEQIYERAFAATKNALTAFDAANEDKNRLRQIANSADQLRQDVIDQDLDYRNQLIEIFGTPYEGTIGTGKPYPAGYKGPDLSLYMYVDVNTVSDDEVPLPNTEYTGRMFGFASDLENLPGPFAGLLQSAFFDPLNDQTPEARRGFLWWTGLVLADDSVVELKLPATASSYTFKALPEWGVRSSPGRLQAIVSEMVQTETELGLAIGDYDGLIVRMENAADLLQAKIETAGAMIAIRSEKAEITKNVGASIAILTKVRDVAELSIELMKGVFEGVMRQVDIWGIVGTANGSNAGGAKAASTAVTARQTAVASAQSAADEAKKSGFPSIIKSTQDALRKANAKLAASLDDFERVTGKIASQRNLDEAAGKGPWQNKLRSLTFQKEGAWTAAKNVGGGSTKILTASGKAVSSFVDLADSLPDLAIGILDADAELRAEFQTQRLEIFEKIKELQEIASNESVTRMRIFEVQERLRALADQYRAALEEGFRIVDERHSFNIRTATATQQGRYQDMAFRISRNRALSNYRSAFDLAQKYVYMAAKAYDYETNLEENDRGSARPLLTEIIRQRTLGRLTDDEPVHGAGGLAEIMATLRDNFNVLEGQLGLNNPQLEENSFSLRRERFGLSPDATDQARWRAELNTTTVRVPDLWSNDLFRRFCRPFAPRIQGGQPVTEPGLVIRFGTRIQSRYNFFGRQLSPGDSAYDPSHYATRIRAAAISFPGYDVSRLAATPRVYLVPAGIDRMYYPNSRDLRVREWNIVDQRIPVPFKTGKGNLTDPTWITALDSLNGTLGEVRRHSAFRAVPVDLEGAGAENVFDARLTGRSVWNDNWLLVIPGSTLLADPNRGLDAFLDSVEDIVITFQTYGNSGN